MSLIREAMKKEGLKGGILNNMIKSGVQVSIRFFDLS